MGSNVGFRIFIFDRGAPVKRGVLESLAQADVAHIADAMNKFEAVVADIKQVVDKERVWLEQIEAGELLKLEEVDQALRVAGATTHGPWRGGQA